MDTNGRLPSKRNPAQKKGFAQRKNEIQKHERMLEEMKTLSPKERSLYQATLQRLYGHRRAQAHLKAVVLDYDLRQTRRISLSFESADRRLYEVRIPFEILGVIITKVLGAEVEDGRRSKLLLGVEVPPRREHEREE